MSGDDIRFCAINHLFSVSDSYCVSMALSKRWQCKTLANQQNIALAKKTLANCQLGRSRRNLGRLMQEAGHSKTLANQCKYRIIFKERPLPQHDQYSTCTHYAMATHKLPRERAVYSSLNV